MGDEDPLVLAERLFTAVEAGDLAAVGDLYAPDIRVWHNHDGSAQSREENLRVLGWLTTRLTVRYEIVSRVAVPGGFVQQHVLHATAPDGHHVEVPACMVGTCRDGHITRLDEYLDSAHIGRILAGAGTGEPAGDHTPPDTRP